MQNRSSQRKAPARPRPRIGLVLGGGGILGSAWMSGTLPALADRLDRPLRELDVVIGTSAGAVLGAALRCGTEVPELLAHHRGSEPSVAADRRPGWLPRIRLIERESGDGLPPLPLPILGSPRLLIAAAAAPWRLNPVVVASALLPLGRGHMGSLVRLVDLLQARIGSTREGWVPGPALWVVAVDYDTGRRVVFGRNGAPRATVSEAVLASCAIPGWLTPQVIGGHRYIDGCIASATSLGLLARSGAPKLDEVYVLAPMASHSYDRPTDPVACVERRVRRLLTRWLDAEVKAVRATGTIVHVLTPGPADLAAMGGNLMNPRRRARVLESALETSKAAIAKAVGLGRNAA